MNTERFVALNGSIRGTARISIGNSSTRIALSLRSPADGSVTAYLADADGSYERVALSQDHAGDIHKHVDARCLLLVSDGRIIAEGSTAGGISRAQMNEFKRKLRMESASRTHTVIPPPPPHGEGLPPNETPAESLAYAQAAPQAEITAAETPGSERTRIKPHDENDEDSHDGLAAPVDIPETTERALIEQNTGNDQDFRDASANPVDAPAAEQAHADAEYDENIRDVSANPVDAPAAEQACAEQYNDYDKDFRDVSVTPIDIDTTVEQAHVESLIEYSEATSADLSAIFETATQDDFPAEPVKEYEQINEWGSPQYRNVFRPQAMPQTSFKPGNSKALQEILAQAKTLFTDSVDDAAEAYFAMDFDSDEFTPRPYAPQKITHAPIAAPSGQLNDQRWRDSVEEILGGSSAPPPSGVAREEGAIPNPFPKTFPNSQWKRVSYPGTKRFYLEGALQAHNANIVIHALPGEYSPIPPFRARGYNRFVRAQDGRGYWIRMKKTRSAIISHNK